jgi:hypothetical protein
MRIARWISVSVMAVVALLPSLHPQGSPDPSGALETVDRFFETFNSRNPLLWASSLHYPHVRKPGVGRPVRPIPPSPTAEEYASRFDYSRIIETGWHHTEPETKRGVHISENKAHVAALYHRYNERGDRIRTTRVTYLVTKLSDRWGIQARFAAGEPLDTENEVRQAEAAALEAVERYLSAFYRGDNSEWASTLRYPFANIRVGGLDEIQTPQDAKRFDRSRLDARFNEGRMTWDSLRVIQTGSAGVNVAAELRRNAPDGPVASLGGLYLVTNLDGQWGVIGRSVVTVSDAPHTPPDAPR